MKPIAIDLFYLPNLEFFSALRGQEEVFLFPQTRYPRQSYANRCQLRLANGVTTLSIPIQGRRPRIPLRDVKVDYSQNWVQNHLRGMQSAYGKAPFFDYFFPYFQEALIRKEAHLWDLNLELLTICLKLLRWPVKLTALEEDAYTGEMEDLRGVFLPSSSFEARNFYQAVAYPQVFGSDFVPNLSVLDVLFCMGTQADMLLSQSQKKREQ